VAHVYDKKLNCVQIRSTLFDMWACCDFEFGFNRFQIRVDYADSVYPFLKVWAAAQILSTKYLHNP